LENYHKYKYDTNMKIGDSTLDALFKCAEFIFPLVSIKKTLGKAARHSVFPFGGEQFYLSKAIVSRWQHDVHECILEKGFDSLLQIWRYLGPVLLADGFEDADEGCDMPVDVLDNLRVVSVFLIGAKKNTSVGGIERFGVMK
jgi:hypothetical protein